MRIEAAVRTAGRELLEVPLVLVGVARGDVDGRIRSTASPLTRNSSDGTGTVDFSAVVIDVSSASVQADEVALRLDRGTPHRRASRECRVGPDDRTSCR
jgi:hypothetical protein